jgi:hypothetical protein
MSDFNGKSRLSTKRGDYGRSKLLAFAVLESLQPNEYLSVRQLCLQAGIGYYSLGRALPNWIRWEYVTRFPTSVIGQGDFAYKILSKGKSWQKLAREHLPNAQPFMEGLNCWQHSISQEKYEKMLKLKFKDFVAELDQMIKASRNPKINL